MVRKTVDVAREVVRLYLDAAEVDPAASDPETRILRAIESMFPGITKDEIKRANNVALDEMAAFAGEAETRCKEMRALLEAINAAERHGQSVNPFLAAFESVAAESDSAGDMTAENVFPTKPDKSKS
jgi:hypothetical protein